MPRGFATKSAQSGHPEMFAYLSAFGAKQTLPYSIEGRRSAHRAALNLAGPLISAGAADALDYKRAMISISGDLIAFDVLPSIFNGNGWGRSSLCGEGCAHASEVPISFALRPRIHSTSGRPEASSGNSRMAVAARACQHGAAHRAGRAGRGTARRTQAPLTHALIGLTRSTN